MSNEYYPAIPAAKLHIAPVFRTAIAEYVGGQEQRDARWFAPRFRFSILYDPAMLHSEWNTLLAFYVRHRGRFESFLFQDFTVDPLTGKAAKDREGEFLGVGNGANKIFYLYENVVASAAIYVNGVLKIQDTEVVVDEATGKVTFVTAPAAGAIVTANVFNAYFRVRFDMDDSDWERSPAQGWRGQVDLMQVQRVTG